MALTREQRIASQTAQMQGGTAGLAAQKTAQTQRTAAQTAVATPAVVKPSPTSVTGLPKTNANTNISGSIKSPAPTSVPAPEKPISSTQAQTTAIQAARLPTSVPAPETDPNAAPWINKPGTSAAPPAGTSAPTGTGLPSSTGATPGATTGTPADTGDQALKDATAEQVAGLNGIKSDLEAGKASDIALIQADYDARKAELDKSLNVLNTLHEQNLASIDQATAASRQANDAALRKMEDNTKLAQEAVDQKYLELKAAQQLENKRMEIKKETALGVLHGGFSTAGVADIEDTIIQGDQALNSLGLSNISQDKEFTNQLNQFYDDYRTKNLEIQQYKMDKVNESYKNLQDSIASIQSSETMSETEKEQAILQTGQNYNSQIAQINGQVVQAKYDLATNVIARSDAMKEQARLIAKDEVSAKNTEADNARTAIQNIIVNYPAASLSSMTPAQKQQMQALEAKAGYPVGMVEQGIETMKETLTDAKINQMNISSDQKQQLIDLRAKLGTKINAFTDGQGNAFIVYSDPITKQSTAIPVGQIGKPDSPWQVVTNLDGSSSLVNKQAGSVSPIGDVSGAGAKGTVQDALSVPDDTVGGECGHFVNDYLGERIMLDLFTDKKALINSNTPQVGSVFVMPTNLKWGHTGFVMQVGTNPDTGKPGILVKDSNWSADDDRKVRTHWFDQSRITGYISTGGGTSNAPAAAPTAPAVSPADKLANSITSSFGNFFNIFTGGNAPKPADMSTKDLADAMTTMNNQAGQPKATNFYKNMSRDELIKQYNLAVSAAQTKATKATADAANAKSKNSSLIDQVNNMSF